MAKKDVIDDAPDANDAPDSNIEHINKLITDSDELEVKEDNHNYENTDEAAAEESEGEKDVTKLTVEELKLTGRTLNALINNGIKTVGGIARKSEKSLSELEGMGDKALSEIKRKLKKLGLELKGEE